MMMQYISGVGTFHEWFGDAIFIFMTMERGIVKPINSFLITSINSHLVEHNKKHVRWQVDK
jgi:hypothetical protein